MVLHQLSRELGEIPIHLEKLIEGSELSAKKDMMIGISKKYSVLCPDTTFYARSHNSESSDVQEFGHMELISHGSKTDLSDPVTYIRRRMGVLLNAEDYTSSKEPLLDSKSGDGKTFSAIKFESALNSSKSDPASVSVKTKTKAQERLEQNKKALRLAERVQNPVKRSRLLPIIESQLTNGLWEYDEIIPVITANLSERRQMKFRNSIKIPSNCDIPEEDVFATFLMVGILTQRFSKEQGEWILCVRKSKRLLQIALGDQLFKGLLKLATKLGV
eukprot:CAMPEP_0114975050 /NCGR_PEP_ID=MMETSP0216-20121206/1869_1 /TAXON_ID=223996 /ORGANISM="Protocruzia adherens, Strain Boccale" /LENGTH=273 /DNA_ID=CAMNT_0002335759 /DNA_START=123 /DNA_END=944 /DNA_ORIENTATION=+